MTAQAAVKASPKKVITGKVRSSYVNVFSPRLNELNGKEEYSMVALIPKSDKDTVAKLKGAMDTAIAEKWPNKPPAGLQNPVHDGDGPKPNGGEYGPECAGHWVLNVKSKMRPGIVDKNLQDVIEQGEFQSGDYCRISVNAYAYDNMRKGVSFGLNNIQVLERGEPLAGGTSAADDFGGATAVNDDFSDVDPSNPW